MDKALFEARRKFEETGLRQGWLQSNSLLAAVSGGGDSVALLWLLKQFYSGKVVAAHIDHCTRNGASHEDAEFVRELCKKWDIPCFVSCVEVEKERKTGESFEMAARRVRYAFFDEIAEKESLEFIALGHNLDDLVETQLLNLFRGAGIDGLRGIREVRGKIVRPLIDFRRAELRELLLQQGIEWREDSTNAETVYQRNKIRNELIPWVKENLNVNFENSMAGLAKQISVLAEEKNARAEEILNKIGKISDSALAVWAKTAQNNISDTELAELVRLQGRKLGLPVLDRKRTEELVRLIRGEGRWRFQWALDIEVCRTKDGIFWLHRKDAEEL